MWVRCSLPVWDSPSLPVRGAPEQGGAGLQPLHPITLIQTEEEDDAPEAQLDAHGQPHAQQSHRGGKQGGECQAHAPDAGQVHDGGQQRIARADKDPVAYDGGGKHRLGKGFDAQGADGEVEHIGIGRHDAYHQRRSHVEHDAHQRHHADAHEHGDAGKAPGQVLPAGPQALAHEGSRGVAHPVAGHVAETLGRDTEGVGSDGHRAQRSHDDGGHDLRPAHDDAFAPHGQADAQGIAQARTGQPETFAPPYEAQFGRTGAEGIEHERGRDHHGQCRTQRGSRDAQSRAGHADGQAEDVHLAGGEDEEIVEDDVEHAHQDVQRTGDGHVATAAVHPAGQHVQLEHGQREDEDEEVHGRVVYDVLASTQPMGQRPADAAPDETKHGAEHQRHAQCLAQHGPGSGNVLCPQQMGHLHVEPRRGRRAQPHEQPGGGGHQTDGGRGTGSQAAHHRSVDVLHDDGRYLGQDRRDTELHREVQLLPEGHGLSASDAQQQVFLILLHGLSRCHCGCKGKQILADCCR